MADLEISHSLTATVDGVTITLSNDLTEVLTAPEKAFADIVTTSTTVTDIALGSSITWSNIGWLGLKNLSETPGEIIYILKSATQMIKLYPGEACSFPPVPDGTAMRWDADAGTPRLLVVAFGDTDAA